MHIKQNYSSSATVLFRRNEFLRRMIMSTSPLMITAVPLFVQAASTNAAASTAKTIRSNGNSNSDNNNNNNYNSTSAKRMPTIQVVSPSNKRIGGLASKIRSVCNVMDELQRDLMQERWDLVANFPAQLRSFVPVFTTYTDSAFPSDAPTDWGLRVALRYEIGRFFAALERLKQSTARRALDEAYLAFGEMSLHLDRYLRVGGLYTYYDNTISNEPYFAQVPDSDIVYDKRVRPLVRDQVLMIRGPDKGKTGIMIGQYLDGSKKCIIKLDRFKSMREIRVVQDNWVAKRLGEQEPDDVFLIPRK